jgi:dephospho-CoA kinase
MVVIGLTGNIGVGKSTVLHYLAHKGAHVVDADQLAHQSMLPDMPAYQPIVDAFGAEILTADGTINRLALGRIVFNDASKLRQLEAIVHPAVYVLVQRALAASVAPVAIIEAIKLLESQRLVPLCQEIWVVTASTETQLRRLMVSRAMNEQDARQRMAAQSSQQEKVKYATRVINNDGTAEELAARLDCIWADLQEKYVTT